MLTVPGVTSSALSKAAAVFWFSCASLSGAIACSPVRSLDLIFSVESSALETAQALRLGSWIANLKSRFPNYESFFITGHVDKSEKGDKHLAHDRADTVRRFLADRGFGIARIHIEDPGTSYNKPISGVPTRSASIDFLPACPHECCDRSTNTAEGRGSPMPDR
ncbi:OmpA family protein [Cupriavidus sp. BIC8F]|uniref:OmpA family protein n=1 Tax=Cupriavidus sp. BIC8F TaxID=3079014 RepID=UPI002915DA9F|nr:OmpA family protein [Cupriavidus sp. BIC8F]